MDTQTISKFFELPKTKTAWWSFWLGLFILLGVLAFVLILTSPVKHLEGARDTNNGIGQFAIKLIAIVVVVLILFIPGIKTSIESYKSGERSWIAFVGYLPYILISLSLIFITLWQIIIYIFGL